MIAKPPSSTSATGQRTLHPRPHQISDGVCTGLLCLLLAALVFAAFQPALQNGFVNYDDPDYVTRNPQVQAGLGWAGVRWAFGTTAAANWHPLTWLSHMLDCQLFGLNAAGHHLTSLLLHVANTLLVFGLWKQLTGTRWRGFFVAAVFGLHPLRVESVAWISERKDLLAAFFWFLTLWSYVRYVESSTPGKPARTPHLPLLHDNGGPHSAKRTFLIGKLTCGGLGKPLGRGEEEPFAQTKPEVSSKEAGLPCSSVAGEGEHPGATSGSTRSKSRSFYFLALSLFTLGLLSKPMVVTLPFVLLLLDYWPLRRYSDFGFRISDLKSRLFLEKLPFLTLAAASSLVTFLAQKHGGAVKAVAGLPLISRLENLPIAYCRYLLKLCWPAGLSVFYPRPDHWPAASVALAWLFLAAVTVLAVRQRHGRPWLVVGWFWFLGTLVPVIGLVQVGEQSMADRYTYLPTIGLLVMAAWSVGEIVERRRPGGFAQITGSQLETAILASHQGVPMATMAGGFSPSPGGEGRGEGEPALTPRFHCGSANGCSKLYHLCKARPGVAVFGAAMVAVLLVCVGLSRRQTACWRNSETLFRHALSVTEDNYVAWWHLGDYYDATGRPVAAMDMYHRAIQAEPACLQAHDNLGKLLLAQGRFDEAAAEFRAALKLKPDHPRAHSNLGAALYRLGRTEDAIREFQAAVALEPGYADAHVNLGNALLKQGRLDAGIGQLQTATALNPADADAHFNLGVALEDQGRVDDAISQFQQTVKLQPGDAGAHNSLGAALGRQGRLDEAIGQFNEAIRLDPRSAEAHCNLGTLLAAKGHRDEAIAQLNQALQIQPDYPQARQQLQALQGGRMP